jgi:release factor glutamine methyltransferase
MEEVWTIIKLIQWTAQYFASKGIPQPRADAEILLAYVLGKQRIELYLNYDQPLKPAELTCFREVIRRRMAREPVQYITGRQEFWSLDLEVTPAVLIPRPETELLVEHALSLLRAHPGSAPLVLEVGTGSGAISLALARELPELEILATDISPAALIVARRNASQYQVAHRIHFVAMDLLRAFVHHGPIFDLIVSNPPYIATSQLGKLAPEITRYEPGRALDGGTEGLSLVSDMIAQTQLLLRPGGSLLVEIGQGQAAVLERDLTATSCYAPARFIKDYAGILRVLHLRKCA